MDLLVARRRVGNRRVNSFNDNQHFFQTVLEAAGRDVDLLVGLAGSDHGRLADRKAFGKNPVIAGSVEPFAFVQFFLVLNVIDHYCAVSLAFQSSVDAILLGGHAGGEGRVGDQHDERGDGVDVDNFSDDTVRGGDGHAFLNAAG